MKDADEDIDVNDLFADPAMPYGRIVSCREDPLKERDGLRNCSDFDLGERFVADFGAEANCVRGLQTWAAFTGKRWVLDTDEVRRWAKQHFLHPLSRRAEDLHLPPHVIHRLGSYRLLGAVLNSASLDERIRVSVASFDSDPKLIGTPDGVVDLRSGALTHDKAMLVLRSTSVSPAAAADCPKWHRFLNEAMGGDAEMVAYRKRQAGYFLLGDQDEKYFDERGPGGNGRGVFFGTLSTLMGEGPQGYAIGKGREFFVKFRGKEQVHPTELAELFGRRLVVCDEFSHGDVLDDARLNRMTGGGTMSAHLMHRDNFQFKCDAKPVLTSNHDLAYTEVTDAIKRRALIWKWTHKPTVPDRQLKACLIEQEGPAILRWAIEGAQEYLREGLQPPPKLRDSTQRYLNMADVTSEWFFTSTERDLSFADLSGDVSRNYKEFCFAKGVPRKSSTELAKWLLENHGIAKKHTNSGDRYIGLRLKVG